MRFISNSAKYATWPIPPQERLGPNGKLVLDDPGEMAQFRAGTVLPYEREIGLKQFTFPGLPRDADTGQEIDPSFRLSAYDTDVEAIQRNWTPERKKAVEQAMLKSDDLGVRFILVEAPKIPAPFPTWDELRGRGQRTTPELLCERVRELGLDIEQAIAYETQNLQRQEVIDALEAMRQPVTNEPEPEPLVAA